MSKRWDEAEFEDHFYDEKTIPEKIRKFVLRRDNYTCRKCGAEEDLTLHHVVYRSRGRNHHPDNLVTLCWRDHRRIHDNDMRVKRIGNHWYFRAL